MCNVQHKLLILNVHIQSSSRNYKNQWLENIEMLNIKEGYQTMLCVDGVAKETDWTNEEDAYLVWTKMKNHINPAAERIP